jgi:hypothetical protein
MTFAICNFQFAIGDRDFKSQIANGMNRKSKIENGVAICEALPGE